MKKDSSIYKSMEHKFTQYICNFFLFGMTELKAQQVIEGIHYHTGLPVQVTVSNGMIEDITIRQTGWRKPGLHCSGIFRQPGERVCRSFLCIWRQRPDARRH
jgi:hypothetical protein